MSYLYDERYLISKGLYYGGTFTPVRVMSDEDADWFLDLEAEWKRSLPRLSVWAWREKMGLAPPPESFRGARDTRQAVFDRSDILALMADYGIQVRMVCGNRGVAKCPFHADTNASLSVWPEQKRYYCFSCQEGGTVFDLVMRLEGMTFRQALEKLSTRF